MIARTTAPNKVHPNDSRTAGADTPPAEPQRAAQRAGNRHQYRNTTSTKKSPGALPGAVCGALFRLFQDFAEKHEGKQNQANENEHF